MKNLIAVAIVMILNSYVGGLWTLTKMSQGQIGYGEEWMFALYAITFFSTVGTYLTIIAVQQYPIMERIGYDKNKTNPSTQLGSQEL